MRSPDLVAECRKEHTSDVQPPRLTFGDFRNGAIGDMGLYDFGYRSTAAYGNGIDRFRKSRDPQTSVFPREERILAKAIARFPKWRLISPRRERANRKFSK